MLKPLTVWITTNGGKFKKCEYQTTLPASWDFCMQVKKQQLEPDMEQWTGSKLGKEYIKAIYCHLAYLTYMHSTSCEMTDWMKHKLESRFLGEISITQICKWHHPYGRKQSGTKEPVDKGERGECKHWLKTQHSKNKDHGIRSHHFMVNRWVNNGNRDFIFLCSKITADSYYSHVIKRCLHLGRKVMTNLDSILKIRDITLQQRPV